MLPLLARAPTGTAGVDDRGRAGDRTLVSIVLGVAAARLLVRLLLVPAALVGSLALVVAVVLVLAGGICLVAGVSGLG